VAGQQAKRQAATESRLGCRPAVPGGCGNLNHPPSVQSSRDLNFGKPSRPDVPPNPIHPSSTHPQQASPLPTSRIQPGGLPWTISTPQSHFTASATSLDPSRRHQTLQAHQAHTALHASRPLHPRDTLISDRRSLRHRHPPPDPPRPDEPRHPSDSRRLLARSTRNKPSPCRVTETMTSSCAPLPTGPSTSISPHADPPPSRSSSC
jgi:hypothetical protein